MNQDSDRAGRIIAYLQRNKFLSSKEKSILMKNIPNKGLVKRLFGLIFRREIFRYDLSLITEEKTFELKNSDQRLSLFVRLNEAFFAGEIDGDEIRKAFKKLFRKIHVREFAFYQDILTGGTCYLDYKTYKKIFAKKEKDNYIRFMRPCDANIDYAWGGKQYIVQPNYQGIQMRLIFEEGEKPKLIGRDQWNYEGRYKKTLKLAQTWFEDSGLEKAEFDCILCRKDKQDRPDARWIGKDHVLHVYDYVDKNLPLKKRLKKVSSLTNYMRTHKNFRIQMMPTEMVTGSMVPKIAKHYCMPHNPFVYRNGIIVKNWDSGYTFGRSADWLCLTNYGKTAVGTLGRATLVGFCPNRQRVYALTNNGLEIEVGVNNQTMLEHLYSAVGFTIEFIKEEGYYRFYRTLYHHGREV